MRLSSLGVFVFFAAFAAFSAKVKTEVKRKEALQAFQRGLPQDRPAPDFTLADANGATVELQEEVGRSRVVLVNFWATWCPPCRLELPQLEKLYGQHGQSGLQILAVNVGEDEETVRSYLQEKPLSFPVLLDKDKIVATRYRVEAFPTTVIIDREGKVTRVVEGLDPYLQYQIDSLLQQKEAR